MKTRQIVLDSILLALFIVSAKISIPVSSINFTLQTLVLFIIIFLVDLKDSLIIMLVYLFLGLGLQLPVFSTGGGYAYIFTPSFGFIVGFLVCCIPSKIIKDILDKKFSKEIINNLIASFIGLMVIYMFGIIHGLLIYNVYQGINKSFVEVLKVFIVPFVVIDVFKILVSSIISVKLKNIIKDKGM